MSQLFAIRNLPDNMELPPVKKNRKLYLVISSPVAAGVLAIAFFFTGWYFGKFGTRQMMEVKPVVSVPSSTLPVMNILIKDKQYRTLLEKREDAKRIGYLSSAGKAPVSARIVDSTGFSRVLLRFKGDGSGHYSDEKRWSFRIRMRDDKVVYGMREFSLNLARERNGVWEWVFHQLAKREGLVIPHSMFVHVNLNGVSLGSYFLEQHVGSMLLERFKRRPGPVLRFDETGVPPAQSRRHVRRPPAVEAPPTGRRHGRGRPSAPGGLLRSDGAGDRLLPRARQDGGRGSRR